MAGNTDRIDSYVNLNAVGKETATFRKQLNEIYEQLQKINNTKVSLQGGDSFKEKAAAAAALRDEQKKLNDIVINSARVQKLEAAALKESALAEAAKQKAQQATLKTQAASIDLLAKEEKQLRATAAAAAAKEKAKIVSITNTGGGDSNPNASGPAVSSNDLAGAAASNDAAASSVNRYTEVVKKKNKAVDDGAKATKKSKKELEEEARQLEINKQLQAQANLQLRNSVKEQLAAKGSLDQRSAALNRLRTVFGALNEEERNSPFGKRLTKVIDGLDVQVKELDKSVGKSQRNVGNYESAFAKGAQKAFSALRLVANILPGIGLAGLLGFAVSPIINYIQKVYESVNALKILQREVRESLNAANASSAGDLAKQASQLQAYVTIAKSDVYTKKEQAEAIAAINKLIPDSIGVIDKQNIATEKGTLILEKYTEQLLKRAKVEVYSTEIGKLETKRFEARTKVLADLSEIDRDIRATEKKIGISQGNIGLSESGGANAASDVVALQNRRAKVAKEYEKTSQFIINEQKKLSKVVLDNSVGIVPDDTGTGGQDKLRAIQKKFFDDQLKDEMAYNKELSKNEDFALKARLSLRAEAFRIEKQLADEQRKTEIQNEREKLDSVLSQKNGKNAIINAQNEYRIRLQEINEKYDYADVKAAQDNENDILVIKASANARKLELDKKYDEEARAQFKQRQEERISDMQDEAQKTLDRATANEQFASELRVKAFNNEENAAQKSARNPLERQQIEEKYNRLRVKNELQTSHDLLKIQLDYANANLAIAKKQLENATDPKDREKLETGILQAEAGIKKIEADLVSLTGKEFLINLDIKQKDFAGKMEQLKATLTDLGTVMQGTFSAIGDFIDINIEKQKNAIAEEQRLNEEKNTREIELINASTDTEEKKAQRIAIVEARQDAQRRGYEERQRQAEERRLKFEKASKIANIILSTALAVVSQLSIAGAGIALAVAVGAIGAAQLAAAIATPIPKYGDGTDFHEGGLAWLGDKYKKERVRLPDGRQFDSADKPTLYALPRGTQVNPDSDKIDNAMLAMSMRGMASAPVVNEKVMADEMIRAFNKGNRQVVHAIENKTTTIVNNTYSGAMVSFKKAQGANTWIQRQAQTKGR